MTWRASSLAAAIGLALTGCATGIFAPPPVVSPGMIAYARIQNIDERQLTEGRSVFVARCVQCHTLPPVAKYSPKQWSQLVARMAGRATLTTADKAVVIAYLQAASETAAGRRH